MTQLKLYQLFSYGRQAIEYKRDLFFRVCPTDETCIEVGMGHSDEYYQQAQPVSWTRLTQEDVKKLLKFLMDFQAKSVLTETPKNDDIVREEGC